MFALTGVQQLARGAGYSLLSQTSQMNFLWSREFLTNFEIILGVERRPIIL